MPQKKPLKNKKNNYDVIFAKNNLKRKKYYDGQILKL